MSERAESPEMDERCLALLHAARVGDHEAVDRITRNISHLYAYAGVRPSRAGMDNLMHIMAAALQRRRGGFGHLVGIEETADYDPTIRKVTNQEKAEAAYIRWRREK